MGWERRRVGWERRGGGVETKWGTITDWQVKILSCSVLLTTLDNFEEIFFIAVMGHDKTRCSNIKLPCVMGKATHSCQNCWRFALSATEESSWCFFRQLLFQLWLTAVAVRLSYDWPCGRNYLVLCCGGGGRDYREGP